MTPMNEVRTTSKFHIRCNFLTFLLNKLAKFTLFLLESIILSSSVSLFSYSISAAISESELWPKICFTDFVVQKISDIINNQIYARKIGPIQSSLYGKYCQKTFVSYGNNKTSQIYTNKLVSIKYTKLAISWGEAISWAEVNTRISEPNFTKSEQKVRFR